MSAITQLHGGAIVGGRYGSFAGRVSLPTVTAAAIHADGLLYLTFSTAVFPGLNAVTFSLHGTNAVITGLSIAGISGIAQLVPLPIAGQTITLKYVAGNVHDGSGNFMASFDNFPVTNNSGRRVQPTCTFAVGRRIESTPYNSRRISATADSSVL